MSGYKFNRLSVMVIEENRHMLGLIAEILHGLGVRDVVPVTDTAAALQELNVTHADLIVTALHMQPLDGIEFVRFARTSPESPDKFVPIIMVTGHGTGRLVRLARDTGVTEFLAKPISAKGLYLRILEAINKPRRFVRTRGFFGPDRRRRNAPHDGPERRKNEPEAVGVDGVKIFAAAEPVAGFSTK